MLIFTYFFFCFTGIDDINADNFIQKLESGVIVCKLAKLIEERCLLNPELGGYYDHLHSRHLSLTPQVLVSLNKVDELGKNYQKVSFILNNSLVHVSKLISGQ